MFVTEMTHGCPIDNFITNSMIVHAESDTPTGKYTLASIGRRPGGDATSRGAEKTVPGGEAPNASILVRPFATCAHTWKDPATGALVVAFEGRHRLRDEAQKRCRVAM